MYDEGELYVCMFKHEIFGAAVLHRLKNREKKLKKDIEIKFFNPKVGLNYFVEKQNEIASNSEFVIFVILTKIFDKASDMIPGKGIVQI